MTNSSWSDFILSGKYYQDNHSYATLVQIYLRITQRPEQPGGTVLRASPHQIQVCVPIPQPGAVWLEWSPYGCQRHLSLIKWLCLYPPDNLQSSAKSLCKGENQEKQKRGGEKRSLLLDVLCRLLYFKNHSCSDTFLLIRI